MNNVSSTSEQGINPAVAEYISMISTIIPSNDTPSTYSSTKDDYNTCCICGYECNPCSQTCGVCARELTMSLFMVKETRL